MLCLFWQLLEVGEDLAHLKCELGGPLHHPEADPSLKHETATKVHFPKPYPKP